MQNKFSVACLLFSTFLAIGAIVGTCSTVFPAEESTKTDVHRWIRQLDAAQLADREAAEAELIRLGPAILQDLPPDNDRMSAEMLQRLGRIRKKLQQSQSEASTDSSTITLQGNIPFSKALAAFQEQSGNTLVDYRPQFAQPVTDPTVNLHFNREPFWPALDQLLDQAHLTIYPFSEKNVINIVNATANQSLPRTGRACYAGPFRFEPIRLIENRDLRDPQGDGLRIILEAAWEPRIKIVNFFLRTADIQAVDERSNPLQNADRETQLEVPINNTCSVDLTHRFRLPPRDVKNIERLKGKLDAVMPGKIETFRFGRLSEAKNVDQRIAHATVTLEQVQKIAAGVEVRMRVRFDDAGDALASHRPWIFNNEAFLESPDGKKIPFASFDTTLQKKNEVGVAFQFRVDQPLEDMTFVYKSPGVIVTKTIEYELRAIPLP